MEQPNSSDIGEATTPLPTDDDAVAVDIFDSVTAGLKYRNYMLTINNYSDEEYESVINLSNEKNVKYMVVGRETAPTTGTPHIHVYIYFVNPVSFNPLKKKFPRARIDRCKGTSEQCDAYCKKDGDFQTFGECPNQGKRSDIDHIRDVMTITPRMREVVKVARSYQSIKVAEQYLKYHETKRNWKPIVKWFYGETGCGKTYTAIEELGEDYYPCMNTGKWFDGYDAHENILVDDMRKNFMTFAEFLKFIDRYAFRVETKGGTRQILAKKIIITSCYHPEHLFSTREDIKQLLRRIDEIRLFGEYHQGTTLGEEEENE